MRYALWIAQGLLALTFLFAGGSKFVMSVEEMNQSSTIQLPGLFLRFIGTCEVLGGLERRLRGHDQGEELAGIRVQLEVRVQVHPRHLAVLV